MPIGQLAGKYEVRPYDIYNWKKKLFESAADIFTATVSCIAKQSSAEQKKIEKLQVKVKDRDEAISYLIRENIEGIDGDPGQTTKTDTPVNKLLGLIGIKFSKYYS